MIDCIFHNGHSNTFASQACLPYLGERRLQIPLAYSSELENRSSKGKSGNVVQRGEEARTWHAGCLSIHSAIHSTNHWQRVSDCILGTIGTTILHYHGARFCSEHYTYNIKSSQQSCEVDVVMNPSYWWNDLGTEWFSKVPHRVSDEAGIQTLLRTGSWQEASKDKEYPLACSASIYETPVAAKFWGIRMNWSQSLPSWSLQNVGENWHWNRH